MTIPSELVVERERERRDDTSIDFENRCIECGDEALDRCQCCGRPLCGRHRETGGGFCQDFTSIQTPLGQIPACIWSLADELRIATNTSLLYGKEDLPDPEEVTREDLENAVREQLPEAVLEAAADRLADAVRESQGNQIQGKGWALHIELNRMVAGKRAPEAEALDAMVDALDDMLRRVERSADDSEELEIANDVSIGMELGLARDEIERVRGTAVVEGGAST
ncbi:hypothetical protein [Halorhabdus sp. CUG00001]|uniref:hypothetical protein n=1 Tax=Halorhabdus sp. CUG00001 TaxID=2600297 RepID=UPI00131A6BAA|nr:hypothetical protein [Halorhabdus sp. CUG00001]